MSIPSITPQPQLRNYTRWTQVDNHALEADLLGVRDLITAYPDHGHVTLGNRTYTPDEARLIGVRLIEAAALADAERAIRQAGT